MLTSIPMVLLSAPLIGYFIGDFIDRKFHTSPWSMVIFTVMGAVSGIRQTITLIKRATGNNDRRL